jgi:hypothetical protein
VCSPPRPPSGMAVPRLAPIASPHGMGTSAGFSNAATLQVYMSGHLGLVQQGFQFFPHFLPLAEGLEGNESQVEGEGVGPGRRARQETFCCLRMSSTLAFSSLTRVMA